jgi:rSAM-partnered protein
MVEKARRAEVERCRADDEWEVLARDEPDAPVRYVGRVRAADAESAHEEATRLWCWYASEVWVCPAREVRTFSVEAAESNDADPAVPESGTENRAHEL